MVHFETLRRGPDRRVRIPVWVRVAFTAILAPLAIAGAAAAENGEWKLLLSPMSMDAFGHDQQVLTIRELDLSASPVVDLGTPIGLDTERVVTNRFALEYSRSTWEDWALGIDLIFFGASQGRPSRMAAAGGAPGADQVIFDAADRSFTSNGPGETLYFSVLGDTDLEVWTQDIYGVKTFAETAERRLKVHLGLRSADFDNDYHGIQGTENASGAIINASSNYDRMNGPLVGLSGEIELGRNTLIAYLGQSVVFGSADLGRGIGDFIGLPPPEPATTIVPQQSYERRQDVSIPITELRMTWLHPIGQRLSLGVTAEASMWSDVPVPPDIVPGGGHNRNTIVFFGIGAAIQLKF